MTSAAFAINGGSVGAKASVSASGGVTATIDAIAGVRSVIWSIASTDESSSPGSYTLTSSGLYGSTVSTTALGAGTTAILLATVSDGTHVYTASAKFFVPTTGGLEVEAAAETTQSSATFGPVGITNAAVRAAGGGSAYPFTSTDPPLIAALASSKGSNTTELAHRDHTHGHGAQTNDTLHALAVAGTSHGFLHKDDKTKLDGQPLVALVSGSTTDATTWVTVATIALPANCGGAITAHLNGKQGTNAAILELKQGVQSNSSVAEVLGTPGGFNWPSAALVGCAARLFASSGNILVQVTGVNATTIAWTGFAFYTPS